MPGETNNLHLSQPNNNQQPNSEEMKVLYPALVEYFDIFDENSKTFRPLINDERTGSVRHKEKRKPFPWGLLFAILCAAAFIGYIVITGILQMPDIG
jgi:hypothetical protein